MKINLKKYASNFSEMNFWNKLTKYAKQAGLKVVYVALLLFYAYRRKETPSWAKSIVIGVLGYLITPIDLIPDLSPIVGYTDDLSILSFGLVTIASYINKDVKEKARTTLGNWFKNYNEDALQEIDKKF